MTRNRLPNRGSGRGQMVVRLLVFVGALVGLFAMHGLSDHGAASHEMSESVNPAVMAISHAGHPADTALGATSDDASTGDPSSAEHSSGLAMASTCLAVLTGAIIGLLLLRPHRPVVFIWPTALAFVAVRPSARRDRDPPCLFELSVLRT